MSDKIEIHGFCDDRFAPVKEAFTENFKQGLELGASAAITYKGEFVVDIWAGYADAARTKPWQEDTIVCVYSTTKVMTAICALMLVDRGELDIEAPVAKYWPEFAAAGKENLPVKYLFSHSSGLAGYEPPLLGKDLYDWDKAVSQLAAQEPWWEPGTASGYHAVTFGHLLGELVRRITGRSLGRFFKEEVADKLGADFYIGMDEKESSRVAELIPPDPSSIEDAEELPPIGMRTLFSTNIDYTDTVTHEFQAAEIPAANGFSNARGIAKAGTALAMGGELDGHHFMSRATVERAIQEQIYTTDLFFGMPVRYGLGFGLPDDNIPLPEGSFYWGGYGGSICQMNLKHGYCLAYAMNKQIQSLLGDERTVKLREAAEECLAAIIPGFK